MTGKKAVHFGCGSIGRGFVGLFECEAGYHVTYVDVVADLIEKLRTTPKYTVTEISDKGQAVKTVSNYSAISSRTNEADAVQAIASANLITSAVGPNILKFIAPVIAKGLEKRSSSAQPAAVIACENAIGNTGLLLGHIREKLSPAALAKLDSLARFANCAVDRIVPTQPDGAGVNVSIEQFYEWVVEEKPFAGMQRPNIAAIHYVPDLQPYIERKLFTLNTAHATVAYLGCIKGYQTIHEALTDAEIKQHTTNVVHETSQLIVKKYGIPAAEQKAYSDKIVSRISNPALRDSVLRVGRDPMRKLGPKDRLVGPAAQMAELGLPCPALLKSIEYGYRFQNSPGDKSSEELAEIVRDNAPAEIVAKVSQIAPDHKLYKTLLAVVEKVKAKSV